ncbi:MAG TPA: chemotaxis protein CheW [Actinomycetes bacterium]
MATVWLCTFKVGDRWLGIEVARVQEILRARPATPVPLAPPVVAGLVNLRGQIVTAVDLRRRLELVQQEQEHDPAQVVVDGAEGAVSLLVDEVGDVLEVAEDDFEPPPPTMTGDARELISGAWKLPDRLLLALDVDAAVTT